MKKRILSRMLKMISNTSFSFITFDEWNKHLIELNNRQRQYMTNRVNKIEESKTTNHAHAFFDNFRMNITFTIILQIMFKIVYENILISQRKRSFYIQLFIEHFTSTICYKCDKTEHYVKNCLDVDEFKIARIHEIHAFDDEIEFKTKNE